MAKDTPKHGARRYEVFAIWADSAEWDGYSRVNEFFKSRPKAFDRARELKCEHRNGSVNVQGQMFFHRAPTWPNPTWRGVNYWNFEHPTKEPQKHDLDY